MGGKEGASQKPREMEGGMEGASQGLSDRKDGRERGRAGSQPAKRRE